MTEEPDYDELLAELNRKSHAEKNEIRAVAVTLFIAAAFLIVWAWLCA